MCMSKAGLCAGAVCEMQASQLREHPTKQPVRKMLSSSRGLEIE